RDAHKGGALALAAVCYAAPERIFIRKEHAGGVSFNDPWPWAGRWDKRTGFGDTSEGEENYGANFPPNPTTYLPVERLDLLVKAGALIAAEIDRLLAVEELLRTKRGIG
ncbi:hypothetical protein LCGC14_2948050, partial [marine sediment metagenome]